MMRLRSKSAALFLLPLMGCASPPSSTRINDATDSAAAKPLQTRYAGGEAALDPLGGRTPTGGEAYHGLIQYRAKDAKEAILEPTLLQANEVRLAAGTKVIGVFVNGEAVAYPLFVLSNHQVVNDEVGGTPISASW